MEGIVTRGKASLPQPPSKPAEWESEQEPGESRSPAVQVGDGPIHVVWSKADQMFNDILQCCRTDRMPRYKGDLELINHSAGSITSEAYQKRWMRKNEVLADAAEKASLAAAWLGGRPYPLERLNAAWTLVMAGQFHDLLPGTATPKAFEFGWNDEIIAMNQFAGVLTSATGAVASAIDTRTRGVADCGLQPVEHRAPGHRGSAHPVSRWNSTIGSVLPVRMERKCRRKSRARTTERQESCFWRACLRSATPSTMSSQERPRVLNRN